MFLSTGYVSPQYHLVFDDLFETVFSTSNDALIDDICNYLFHAEYYLYFYDDEFISGYPLFIHPPPLDEVWLSDPEHCSCCRELEESCYPDEDCV